MNASRLLPPLLLLGVLGVILWRAAERPQREVMQKQLRARWLQPNGRGEVRDEALRYLDRYSNDVDRRFAAHALMRAREPGRAMRARWADLDRPLPVAEVQEFARDALVWLGWEDEPVRAEGEAAVPGAWPSPASIQCVMALLEKDHAPTREWLEGRVRTQPIEEIYATMRRSRNLSSPEAREVVMRAARERVLSERARGLPTHDWEFIAALLAPRRTPYPERDADLDLLIGAVKGTWREQGYARWNLACRALGEAGDARAVEALHEVAAQIQGSTKEKDQLDLHVLRLSLLTAGDWGQEAVVRPLVAGTDSRHGTLRSIYMEAILWRWRDGDKQAIEPLTWLWDEVGAGDSAVRERLARGLLVEGPMPGPEVPVEHLLQGLEAENASASLVVVAKSFRLRRGEAGAREKLLRWLTGDETDDMASGSWDPERALAPPISGLRALYLYD